MPCELFGNFPFVTNQTDESFEQYVLHATVKGADYVVSIPADWKTLKFLHRMACQLITLI
jgi:hypothetical protein